MCLSFWRGPEKCLDPKTRASVLIVGLVVLLWSFLFNMLDLLDLNMLGLGLGHASLVKEMVNLNETS